MKAILEFSLPEESEAHSEALFGASAFCALHEIKLAIRSYKKHGRDGTVEKADSLISEIMGIACEKFGGVEV